ncbi:MAG: GDSL family lipase [Sphingomonas sp.]|uniref:GDSL-type esterase/lipase family protein n=1 Tax=Sphingomonas sp. TaxID=28214 RepID=UPI001205477B|nr:GDSL-type esterase/lipase family protein [Sphingomonas sp.]THD36540.1 MAG: GDSL family lipase [Sphingomonas sp.]
MAVSAFPWRVSLVALALLGASTRPAMPARQIAMPNGCPTDGKWAREGDWAWECRYRAENQRLIASRAKIDIVFIGDSITEGWAIADPAFFAPGRIDRGISGQTSPQMLDRFTPDVLELKPRVVHIMAGTNDIAGNSGAMSLEWTENVIRHMAEYARAHGIRVVIGSVLPARAFGWRKEQRPAVAIAALNRWLRNYANRRGFAYADYYSAMAESDGGLPARLSRDGVHPNKAGYAIMRPIAEAAIAKALAR